MSFANENVYYHFFNTIKRSNDEHDIHISRDIQKSVNNIQKFDFRSC